MKSSAIYNRVNNSARKSDCSFGAGNGFDQTVLVGTSSSNSHELARISVEKYHLDDGTTMFTMFLDGAVVKRGILNGSDFEMRSTEVK
jgi:hypothetical protein